MKIINLPIYGIRVTIDKDGCGTITSDLETKEKAIEDKDYNSAMDGIESLLLACACSGVNIETPAFLEAIETAVESCSNNL
jgi:hypothetical protein